LLVAIDAVHTSPMSRATVVLPVPGSPKAARVHVHTSCGVHDCAQTQRERSVINASKELAVSRNIHVVCVYVCMRARACVRAFACEDEVVHEAVHAAALPPTRADHLVT
jgi:hypothetical protein